MKIFCIKLILGFANYFTRNDESVYDTFNLMVGRNGIIVMFFFIVISILISFGYEPFYILDGLEKWERQGMILLGYLLILPVFTVLFPTEEIRKVKMSEKELKHYYILNAVLLFSFAIIFIILVLKVKGKF